MSLMIRNLQTIVRLNEKLLHSNTKLLVQLAGYKDYDLGIMLVCDTEMAQINNNYRGIKEATDVLAFPFHEIPVKKAGQLPIVGDEEKMLGDIVLGMPYIKKQSQENGTDLMSDVVSHVTHGICHLVGFDHHTPSTWQAMYNKELHILECFNQQTGFICTPLLKVGHYYYDS